MLAITSDPDDTKNEDKHSENSGASNSIRRSSFIPIRKYRVKWTRDETSNFLKGLRKHGRNYSAICNDKSLQLNPCRRITDIRERFRVLHRNGTLPADLQSLTLQGPSQRASRGAKLYLDLVASSGETVGRIIDVRRGTYDEPVVRLHVDGGYTEWISSAHFPRHLIRNMMIEFIERTKENLKIALELAEFLDLRPEEPLGEHNISSTDVSKLSPVSYGSRSSPSVTQKEHVSHDSSPARSLTFKNQWSVTETGDFIGKRNSTEIFAGLKTAPPLKIADAPPERFAQFQTAMHAHCNAAAIDLPPSDDNSASETIVGAFEQLISERRMRIIELMN